MLDDLSELITFERSEIHYQLPPPDANNPRSGIAVRAGHIPVLFTAPHGCKHRRSDRWKQEDEYTSAIAEWLHRLTNAHTIYITHRIDPDPHDDESGNIFKQVIAEHVENHHVKLVIDLHGSMGTRNFGISLGTMNGITCPAYEPVIIRQFEKAGFCIDDNLPRLDRLVINHPLYTGGLRMPTITRFVYQELHLPAIQVEINAWLRLLQRLPHSTSALRNHEPDFQGDHERFRRMMSAFVDVVNYFAETQ